MQDTKKLYFSKEFGGKHIKTALQIQLISGLQNLLDEIKPINVDPGKTFTTSEGRSIFIIVIPFKNFEGPSLFLKLCHQNSDAWVNIGWASLPTPPWCCHDALDAGYYEKVISAETEELLIAETLEEVTRQHVRKIYVEKYYANKRWIQSIYKLKTEIGEDLEIEHKKTNIFYRLLYRSIKRERIVETVSLMSDK